MNPKPGRGTMDPSPQSMQQLSDLLRSLDGRAYSSYQTLTGMHVDYPGYQIRFVHIQGSTGAFPASVLHLLLAPDFLGLPDTSLGNEMRIRATADYLVRAFTAAIDEHTRPNRGVQGSGSFQPTILPPQVLERNLVRFKADNTRIAFRLSLPGSMENRILGRQAEQMLVSELPAIVLALRQSVADKATLTSHCDTVEDMLVLQQRLSKKGLVAFVGDGAVLPRKSSISHLPLEKSAVRFKAPDELAVHVAMPHAGRIRGLGIGQGITVIIGGGFHGKSTLVNALAKAVYPHVPGDGRQQVASCAQSAFVSAEQGRAVNGVNVSSFMGEMPGNANPERFWTRNASGSTSQAAAIVEAVTAGARLLLIDEDSSATNFLFRDRHMRALVPDEPITPLLDRVRDLYQQFGVSTLIVAGSSSAYLGVADQVIAMRNYLPQAMSQQVGALDLPEPVVPAKEILIKDNRRLLQDNFNPSFHNQRLGKSIAVRIKPLRLQETVLEYGNQQLDLTSLTGLVDGHQVLAIGYALLLAAERYKKNALSPSDLAKVLNQLIEAEGIGVLGSGRPLPVFLARPRQLELAGAINRLRNLRVEDG